MKSKFLMIILAAVSLGLLFSACSDSPVGDPPAAEGKKLYAANCLSCHPIDPSQPRVGPDLVGLSARLSSSGRDAAGFFEESIREPEKEISAGFQNLMPSADLLGLSDAEIEAVLAYLAILTEDMD